METVKLYLEVRIENGYIIINTGEQIPYENFINKLNGFGSLIKDAKLATNSDVLSDDERQLVSLLRASKSNAIATEAKKYNEVLNQANQKAAAATTQCENIKAQYINYVNRRRQDAEKQLQELNSIVIK